MSRGKIAEGQVPAFFVEPPPEPALPILGSAVQRPDVGIRAGTTLDHRWTHQIVSGAGTRGTRVHGVYDESQRLYQTGGELSNFVFWKKKLVSIAADAWRQIFQKADWIEIIDHERNDCWRIPMKRAVKYAVKYNAGIGERIGIPIKHWDIVRASGTYRQKGVG